jgi:putative ABC transport system permease protein
MRMTWRSDPDRHPGTVAGYGSLSSITVQAKSRSRLNAAQIDVEDILNKLDPATTSSGSSSSSSSNFDVVNQGSILEASESTSGVFTTLLGEVAASRCWLAGSA